MARNGGKNLTVVLMALFFIALAAALYMIVTKRAKYHTNVEHFADLGNTLYMNQSMEPLNALTSMNILYKLLYTANGNLVIVKTSDGTELWSTNVKEKNVRPGKVTMNHDGNLVLYDADGKIYWTSGTNRRGVGPYRMELQNNGSIAIFDSKNENLWDSAAKN